MTAEIQQKFHALRDAMNTHNLERQEEIDIVLTALLSKFHAVLVGPPGTAKSQISYDVVEAFDGAYFKYLMGKYTTPEEIFGPMDISKIKNGIFERNTHGKLPEADVAFLDEVFKANTSILNMLLTIMNEGEFDNGTKRLPVPLRSLVAASNELPDGEELNAMFDRFHFRKIVDYIHEPANFIKLLKGTPDDIPQLTLADLDEAYSSVSEIHVGDDILETLYAIRQDLFTEGIVPSDRRFRQSVRALKSYAWLNGRTEVTDDDFIILQHMLWSSPQEFKPVTRTILQHTNEINMKANEVMDAIDEIAGQAQSALAQAKQDGVEASETLVNKGLEWFGKGRKALVELKKLRAKAEKQGRSTQQVDLAIGRTKAVLRLIGTRIVGISDDDDTAEDIGF